MDLLQEPRATLGVQLLTRLALCRPLSLLGGGRASGLFGTLALSDAR
jgi:hypothetical protein